MGSALEFWDSGFWFLVFGFWFLVFGFWFLVFGFGFWVLGFGFWVLSLEGGRTEERSLSTIACLKSWMSGS